MLGLYEFMAGGLGRIPSSSATFMRNALRSSNTLFLPRSINSSKRIVNCAMRSRKSLKPKSMLGRESAIDGALAPYWDCPPENELPKRLGVMVRVAMVAVE